jgi:hypothetical protein
MKGNLWKVSDLLDETDIQFAQKQFFDLRSGYEYYGLTEKVLMRMAREAEALYKIYTTYRVRRDLFETYLREQYRKENEL